MQPASKSPEEIMEEYENIIEKRADWKKLNADLETVGMNLPTESTWLRSSLSSVLCWAAEQMPENLSSSELPYDENTFEHGVNNTIDDCKAILINEAKKISNNE